MKKNNILILIASVVVCQLAGILGSFFTITSINSWYSLLNKPFFNPPNWIFGPVWTTLYLMMGISLYLIIINKSKNKKLAYYFFTAQLILNSLWSIIFFGLKSPFFAFLEIIILWCAILLTIIKFYKISKPASYLLMPYLAWVSFAAVLNLAIYFLN